MSGEHDLTRLLLRWRDGDDAALARLLEALYGQLERLAHDRLAGERTGHTLDTGALVHEAYLRFADLDRLEWRDRAHFLAVASRTMRRVLVDHARRHQALKRGGNRRRVDLDAAGLMTDAQVDLVLELDDVLERLKAEHPRQADAVTLYYVGGLSQQEVAAALQISQPTVVRDLEFGRAWLARAWRGDVETWRDASVSRARRDRPPESAP